MNDRVYKFKKTQQINAILKMQELTGCRKWLCEGFLQKTLNCRKFFYICKTQDKLLIFNDIDTEVVFDYPFNNKQKSELQDHMDNAYKKAYLANNVCLLTRNMEL